MEQAKSKNKQEKKKLLKTEAIQNVHVESESDITMLVQTEQEVRFKLRELKEFYTNLLTYGVTCVCSILVWLFMGCGVFWPIWVIIGCGISVALKAISLGQIPMLEEFFPFLGATWEENQLEKVLNKPVGCTSVETIHESSDLNPKSD